MSKILVVDDDPVSRKIIVNILAKNGIRTIEAADGDEALSMIQHDPTIVLVITDVKMPKLDGRDLALAIRALPGHQHLPILIMSGAVGPKFINNLLADGITAFMPKPVDPEIVIEYVERYLKKSHKSKERKL
ncbi:MAG: response regulator [Lentisphaerae bacterium]|nr:MAG: response regulator [Lentisphaerota bacterium]